MPHLHRKQKLLVFSDDWGRHPSSCQHLVRKLLPEFAVTWVNTIGMRPPRLDWVTVKRGLEKVRGWLPRATRPPSESQMSLPENLSVVDMKMWPWMKRSWDRALNRRLLQAQLRSKAQGAIALTTIPIVANLVGRLPVAGWVYYCVDDFSVWPGLDQRTMLQMEDELILGVDRIVAVSETLQARIIAAGRPCSLLTHGVDLAHWHCVDKTYWERHQIEPPVYLFWGVIDQRLDTEFLSALSRAMSAGTIVLVGPSQNPDPRIAELRHVRQLGAVGFDELPEMAAGSQALIMPYRDAAVTRAMQPLKFKEYLATGKPVIARRLPALEDWSDCADLVDEPLVFATRVISSGNSGIDVVHIAARQRLSGESWSCKAARLREVILGIGARWNIISARTVSLRAGFPNQAD